MNKNILWLIALCFITSFSFVACDETDGEVDPYFNWEERNQLYIDSIAGVARANQGDEVGQWKVIRSYKLPPLGLSEMEKVDDYVYCKILEIGDGVTPLYTDTAGVFYRGYLINGTSFDGNFQGDLDVETNIPMYSPSIYETSSGTTVSDLGVGAKTATMAMKVGDRWEVYIPYQLGYGESGTSGIPGYSTLIFDWYLADVIPLKGYE